MLLASYALQAEVGDYNQTLHGSDYFVPEHYLPQRVSRYLVKSLLGFRKGFCLSTLTIIKHVREVINRTGICKQCLTEQAFASNV